VANIEELGGGALNLAGTVAVQPPERLRASVLEAVAVTPQSMVVMDLAEYRRKRRTTIVFGVAAALLAVLATVATVIASTSDPAADILATADVATIELTGPAGSGRFTYSMQVGRGVFVSESLPDVPEGRTYQLWLIDPSGPSPAGLFAPEDDGRSRAVVGELTTGVTVGITEEPAGGSDQPTGEVLLAGDV
jgi:anti-sigma-K factor RskA